MDNDEETDEQHGCGTNEPRHEQTARTNEELRESEAKYRLVVEHAGEGILVAQDGRLKLVNPMMRELTGYTEQELTSRPFTEFLHPDDRNMVLEYHKKRQRGELPASFLYPFRVLAKDGSVKWVETNGAMTTWEGRPAAVNFLRDITDRIATDRDLRESEAKYRLVVDNAGEGIFVAQDGKLKFVNPWMSATSGYSEEELLGMPFSNIVHPEDRELVYRQHLRRLKGELPANYVYSFRVLTKSGSILVVEMKGAPTTWEGRPASVNFVFDITQRKQAEDILRYRAAFEKLIMTLSTEFINLESERIDSGIDRALRELGLFMGADRSYVFQFSGRGMVMSNTHEWCGPGIDPQLPRLQNLSLDTTLPWFAKCIKAQKVFHVPSVADLPAEAAAEKREFERESIQSLLCVPMVYRHSLIGFLGFDAVRTRTDWTDDAILLLRIAGEMLTNALMRKRAEDELKNSEARFRSNFEQASVGIVDTTLAGGFLWVNRRFCEITGFSVDELRTRTFRDITHAEDLAQELQDYQLVLQGKAASYSREKRYIRKDRSVVWVNLSATLVRDAEGVPKRFIGVVEDISARKRMEEELFRSQKLESLGVLAGGIAHDFNNMLAAIAGQIGVARMKFPPGDALARRLEEIENASLRAKGLTQQLLTFAKGGAPIKTALSPERLVRDAAGLVLSGTNVDCSVTAGGQACAIEADEGQIGQALNNMIINACQAMPGGGTVRIGLENCEVREGMGLPLRPGRYVRIAIADQGSGIPAEHLPKIFDPYYTTKPSGSGLGLAVCYSIVKNHGGHIAVESPPGKGATFTVYLPACDKKDVPEQPALDVHLRGNGRVLVMDDDEMIRMVTGEVLLELGYEPEYACNGGEAIERYRQARESGRPFAIVIMDLTIVGGMGGKETIGKLREYDPGVKAIVSSGYANDPIMADFRDHGFSDVIVKPYKTVDLSKKLHALMAGSGA
ncbi:MAG: PAS domain S-box protein [Nitrospirota bacterium]